MPRFYHSAGLHPCRRLPPPATTWLSFTFPSYETRTLAENCRSSEDEYPFLPQTHEQTSTHVHTGTSKPTHAFPGPSTCPLTGKVTASVGFTLGFPGFNTEGPTPQVPRLSLANKDGLSSTGLVGSLFMDSGGVTNFRMGFCIAGAEPRTWRMVGLPQLRHLLPLKNHFTSWYPQDSVFLTEVLETVTVKVPGTRPSNTRRSVM